MKKIINVLIFIMGTISGIAVVCITIGVNIQKRLVSLKEHDKKMTEFYNLLVDWLTLKQDGKSLAAYFESNRYITVAIYGMKELGERLVEELRETRIEVKYVIDKNAGTIYTDYDVLTPYDELPEVDAIVVTAITYFNEIEGELSSKINCPIVSLEDVIWESMK